MSRFGGMRPYGRQSFPREDNERSCPMDKFISRKPLGRDFSPNRGSEKYVSFFSYGGLGITERQFLEAYKEVLELSLRRVDEALRIISKNREEN